MTRKQNIYLLLTLLGFMTAGLALLFLLQSPERGWLILPLITCLPAVVITLEQLSAKAARQIDLIEEIEIWLRLQRNLSNPDKENQN
jgi:hypothetical protein